MRNTKTDVLRYYIDGGIEDSSRHKEAAAMDRRH